MNEIQVVHGDMSHKVGSGAYIYSCTRVVVPRPYPRRTSPCARLVPLSDPSICILQPHTALALGDTPPRALSATLSIRRHGSDGTGRARRRWSAWHSAPGSRYREKEGIGALVSWSWKPHTSYRDKISETIAIRHSVGFAPGVITGGLLRPLRGWTLVKDMVCWSPYQTAYGTVTGELHPPPRQGNARLTSSTTAPLNITD